MGKNKKKKRKFADLFRRKQEADTGHVVPNANEAVVPPMIVEATAKAFDYSKANDAQKKLSNPLKAPSLLSQDPAQEKHIHSYKEPSI